MSQEVLWRGSAANRLLAYFVVTLSAVLTAVIIFLNPTARPEKQISGAGWIPVIFLMAILPIVGVVFSKLHVIVKSNGVIVGFGPAAWPKLTIKWENVVSVEVIDVRPTEWGGWGYRWVPWKKATAAVMRSGEGLHFKFANGKQFVVTVDGAENALAAIRRALDELPPSN